MKKLSCFVFLLMISMKMFAVIPPTAKAVDLGLPSGTLWANMNVGATSPEQYGDYYAWGETTPKDIYKDLDNYWYKYKFCVYEKDDGRHPEYITITKYIKYEDRAFHNPNPHHRTEDNKTELDLKDDAAYVNWGSEWRMPSSDQIVELKEKCTWTDDMVNGIAGFKVTGPNGNSIFLPPAEYVDIHLPLGINLKDYQGSHGYYWSRTLYLDVSAQNAICLKFDIDRIRAHYQSRFSGCSIRAVKKKK